MNKTTIKNKINKFIEEFKSSEEYKKMSPQGRRIAIHCKAEEIIQSHYDGNEIISVGWLETEEEYLRHGDIGIDKNGNRYSWYANDKEWKTF